MTMLNNRKKKAIIIGGGIGGLTTALFLKLAGIESEIYEARSAVEGYSLSLSCNGIAVLQALGLNEAVYAEGSILNRWEMWNGKGKRLGEGVLAGSGMKSVFIKRVPLLNIILEEVEKQGIPIYWDKKLSRITDRNDGVEAAFEDGSSAQGDLLIGSDGVHSRTRQILFPDYAGSRYTGLMNSGGFTPGFKLPSPPETLHFLFGEQALFGYHVGKANYIYWFVNWTSAEQPVRGSLDGITDDNRKNDMLARFQHDQPFIREIIQSSETTFPYFPSFTLPKQPPSWHKGHVVLLGDSAHAISPSSGQGASMALEDAIVLAKCLRDIPKTPEAFAVYERQRRKRTIKMYDVGEKGDSGKFATSPGQKFMRDLMTPLFLKLFANPKASDWMYSYRVNWETKVSLNV